MNDLIADFHGTPVTIIEHDHMRWLTAEQVGVCLGYSEANAGQGIRNLHNRHADEFTEADTCQIKLSWQGQMREMRVFSHTGCNLLAFFSNTARAKDFRAWAKQVLAGQAPVVLPASTGPVKITRHIERLAMEQFVAGRNFKEIGQALGISRSTVHMLLHAQYRFSPAAGPQECTQELACEVAERHLEIEERKEVARRERLAQKFLANANNQMLANALEAAGSFLLGYLPPPSEEA
jgi:hypothetical protein